MKKHDSVWKMITLYRINSIFVKYFTLAFNIFFVPITIISMAVFFYIQSNSEKDIRNAYEQSLSKISDTMDVIFDDLSKISIRLAADKEITRMISGFEGLSGYDSKMIADSVFSKISISSNRYINSIYLYSNVNNFIFTSSGYYCNLQEFYDVDWTDIYSELKPGEEKFTKLRTGVKTSLFGAEKNYITSLQITPIDSLSKSGAVIINVDISLFDSFFSGENTSAIDEVYIINNSNTILYNKNLKYIGQSAQVIPFFNSINWNKGTSMVIKTEGQKKLIVHARSKQTGNSYISVVSTENTSNKTRMSTIFWGFLITGFIFSGILAFIISWSVYKPYGDIISIINNPEKGNEPGVSNMKKGLNEFWYIFSAITSINLNKKDLEENLSQKIGMLKKSQSIALQSQINPHFLYNTLNAIKWMVMEYTQGENEASNAITTLSELLRISLETTDNLNSIRNEIEHAKKYISIEKLRFEDMFEVIWDIPEEHMDYLTVKLTLQPIIENSIYHGIKQKEEKGLITIRSEDSENSIIIIVEDNGLGIDEEIVNNINLELQQENIKEDRNIGLKNVSQRIRLVFGIDFGVEIHSQKEIMTQVKIVIPKVKQSTL